MLFRQRLEVEVRPVRAEEEDAACEELVVRISSLRAPASVKSAGEVISVGCRFTYTHALYGFGAVARVNENLPGTFHLEEGVADTAQRHAALGRLGAVEAILAAE